MSCSIYVQEAYGDHMTEAFLHNLKTPCFDKKWNHMIMDFSSKLLPERICLFNVYNTLAATCRVLHGISAHDYTYEVKKYFT